MEVLVTPSFTIEVASSSAFIRDRSSISPPPDMLPAAAGCSLAQEARENGVDAVWNGLRSGSESFGSGKGTEEADCYSDSDSDSSSSIGVTDDDSDDECVSSAVQSKLDGGFGALRSMEESLPMKRGLSNHFSGKSKSFANLAEANSMKDVEKPENPLNKRRRIVIASKWASRSSFYDWRSPKSMPLLALNKEHDDDGDEEGESQALFSSEDDEHEHEHEEIGGRGVSDFHQRRLMSFKSRTCYCLADLQR